MWPPREILEQASADSSYHAGTEHHSVPDLSEHDRHTRYIGVHLYPITALRGATTGDHAVYLKSSGLHGAQVVGRAIADRFLNSVVEMRRSVHKG